MFPSLENLDFNVGSSRMYRSIGENIKSSAKNSLGSCQLKRHYALFVMNSTQNYYIKGSSLNDNVWRKQS
jgi:hypothetical protein